MKIGSHRQCQTVDAQFSDDDVSHLPSRDWVRQGVGLQRKRTKRIKASGGELEGKLQYLSQYLRERNISNKKQERARVAIMKI
jgi:hypothetical protein